MNLPQPPEEEPRPSLASTGALAGAAGGVLLALAPGSAAPLAVVPVLAVIGGGCGALGAAAVGAGLSIAESVLRSRRTLAMIAGGAAGGGIAGLIVQLLGHWSLAVLVGVDAYIGGGLEGLIIGGAAGSYIAAKVEMTKMPGRPSAQYSATLRRSNSSPKY